MRTVADVRFESGLEATIDCPQGFEDCYWEVALWAMDAPFHEDIVDVELREISE